MQPSPATLQNILRQAIACLTETDTPQLDAEILLTHVLQKPRSYLFAWPERVLTEAEQQHFLTLLTRRLAGEPIAHLLGEKEFWSLPLSVTPDTLIPRPDTELLVAIVLERFPAHPPQCLADLGTGSGAIALAIATERPNWRIIATDFYPATLAVAQENAGRLGLKNVHFYQGDWCAALPPEKIPLIVSNPPYIAAGDPHLSALSYEPAHALISGKTGLDDLHCIIMQAPLHLTQGGWLFLEHGFDQAPAVRQKMEEAGYEAIQTYPDIAGNPRVTGGRWG
jgi:release factor glutamine methyltransferase